ncbi:glycosyltransferase family protein [Nannocystis pusilla]|uniref:glycosyltransferase family protein n=1 Tax=Nannocystis pusilla TaxID=889268 RepID=UPI003B76E19F
MARVSLVVHGRGRGHASRAVACARALRDAGHALHVFAGGDAEHVLKDMYEVTAVPTVRPGLGAVSGWLGRLASDADRFAAAAPECVVSDGDQPSLVVARRRKVGSVAIDHGLALTHSRLPIRPPAAMRLYERLNNAPLALADRLVAVHFLPFEVSDARVAIARPDLRDDLRGPVTREGFLLAYFRDDNGRDALALALAAGARVVCFGERDPQLPGLVFRRSDRAGFADHLRRCDGVITSAGSNVLAECVMLRKPALALYKRGDAEQALNARLAEHAGVALARSFEDLRPGDIADFLVRVRGGEFAAPDLVTAMPPVSEVVVSAVAALLV